MEIDMKDILIMQQERCKNNIKGILYYDETNNFRRLSLTENGTNNSIENINFVLGGIGNLSKEPIDCSALLSELKIGKSVEEIKFSYFARGKTNFIEILNSQYLNILFKWITANENLFIHFRSMNYVFYILIDIVDEALSKYMDKIPGIYTYHLELKSALYEAIKSNLDAFIKQLHSFEFPDISKANIRKFAESVLTYVEQQQCKALDGQDDFNTEFLRQIIKAMRNDTEFIFLSGDKKYKLFDGYVILYATEIAKFDKAHLIFDREPNIELKLKSIIEDRSNYEFKDSKSDVLIQISDVIVGFVSKLMTYVESVNETDLSKINMNKIQKETLRLFFDIENDSCNKCKYFFEYIQPDSFCRKIGLLEKMI
jgi:uncharacterized protein involved in tolerance to divalent cations